MAKGAEANASGGDAGKIVESLWTDLAAQGAEDYLKLNQGVSDGPT